MSEPLEKNQNTEGQAALDRLINPRSRRDFLRFGSAGIAALAAAACDTEHTRTIVETMPPDTVTVTPPPTTYPSVALDFSTNFGVLNYAYALEQLEAAFYTQVVASPYSGMSDGEMRLLTDLRDHEVVHRDFLAAAIPALGGTAIGALTPNFTAINFSSRSSVLTTARAFEDLGVAAYNGAAQYLSADDSGRPLLIVAGKIVSVEARHAAAIRDLLNPRSQAFAPSAFDDALPPDAVLSAAAPYVRNSVSVTGASGFASVNLTA